VIAPVAPAENPHIFSSKIRKGGWVSGFTASNIPIFEAAHATTTANFPSLRSCYVPI
jgi:hypothetical protein